MYYRRKNFSTRIEIPDGPDGDTFACYKCSATYEGVDLLEGDPDCLNNPE